MSVEAPERIWLDVKAMSASSVAGRAPFFGVGYVRIDKLEELALHTRHADAYLQSAQGAIQRAEAAEAALAEAKRENEALRGERDFLQEILDTRPAINAALPESYIRWSQSLYSGEAVRASLSARNAGGNDA